LSARTLDPGSPTSTQDQDRAQVGLAYRDNSTNIWNALARYEYRTDYNNAPLTGTDSRTQIAAVLANYTAALVAGRAQWDLNPRWDVGVLASTTSGGGSRDQGVALELGRRVFDNLWVSVGGIAGRYADTELFSANSSWRGVYARLRFKFDEKSFRLADPATNRALDAAASTERL